MQFHLTYRGSLKSNRSSKQAHIQMLRRYFHPQLKQLWEQAPLSTFKKYVDPARTVDERDIYLLEDVGNFRFAPLVSQSRGWGAIAELEILFLRPGSPGDLIGHGGDLDNRIKTLFDGLRVPSRSEIPTGDSPGPDEIPFYCLLQDDSLIKSFAVTSDRLLSPQGKDEVSLVIKVTAKGVHKTMGNDPIW